MLNVQGNDCNFADTVRLILNNAPEFVSAVQYALPNQRSCYKTLQAVLKIPDVSAGLKADGLTDSSLRDVHLMLENEYKRADAVRKRVEADKKRNSRSTPPSERALSKDRVQDVAPIDARAGAAEGPRSEAVDEPVAEPDEEETDSEASDDCDDDAQPQSTAQSNDRPMTYAELTAECLQLKERLRLMEDEAQRAYGSLSNFADACSDIFPLKWMNDILAHLAVAIGAVHVPSKGHGLS
jgi:hypothetical protein